MVSVWKKDLEKHRQLLIVNWISCNELNHIHIAAIRGKIPITNMSVVIDYNEKIAGENVASFNEFIDAIIVFVEQNGGTLEDAIIMANDTYFQL